MNTQQSIESVGVIVARFQVPDLHAGHRFLIEYVLERHSSVLIILGVAPLPSERNPLSFEMRKAMINASYPTTRLTIIPSTSLPSSYAERSRRIDELIKTTFPDRPAVLYGSRDSFICTYQGVFAIQEVPTIFEGSATEIRTRGTIINSSDFRAGVIHAFANHAALCYPATDVAVLHPDCRKVLLVGKVDEEGKLRFPGVLLRSEIDTSYEYAAQRCLAKELPTITVNDLQMIGSCRVADWRCRKTRHAVITVIHRTTCLKGELAPGTGVDTVEWVNIDRVSELLVESHRPIAEILKGSFGN